MSSEMRIGFSMHPRWVGKRGLESFVTPLRRAGLAAFEFELDDHLDLWPEFEPLMEEAVNQGIDLCFHAAYRAPHSLVGFCAGKRQAIVDGYRPLLSIAERWGQRLGSPRPVVVHAAAARLPADRSSLVADTRAFLEWALERFPHLIFTLENNTPSSPGEIKVGDGRRAVLDVLTPLHDERVKICWDMGHDYLSHNPAQPEAEWLGRVAHVHVHDVDEHSVDHYPLVFGRVPHRDWLALLKAAHMHGTVVLELKGGQLKGWPLERIDGVLVESIAALAEEVR